jgi:hypothetical protein
VGKYNGPICLVISDDLLGSELLQHDVITQNNVIIKHFPNIPFSESFIETQRKLVRDPYWFPKIFQYHKFHLFNTFFKQWDFVFYVDCGIHIFNDVTPIIETRQKGVLLAHSDAYPTYNRKLRDQFDQKHPIFRTLNELYDLNVDYCQTTIMLYDTSIIEMGTFSDLLRIAIEYPISITNDQGIIALYFTNVRPLFRQIQTRGENTFYYDYLRRGHFPYIMLKSMEM